MEYILVFIIVILVGILLWNRSCIVKEGFETTPASNIVNYAREDAMSPVMGDAMANAHGNAPAGIGALPGHDQEEENAHAPYVNPVPPGNPQNTDPKFKKQPPSSSH